MDTAAGAIFNATRTHRYMLWRSLSDLTTPGHRLAVCFVGLNPSTADEQHDDPTVRRCINFARTWGFAVFYMLNAFAFRATDPREMKAADDPIGPANSVTLHTISNHCDLTVACWGNHGTYMNRAAEVLPLLKHPACLGTTKTDQPRHPLYLSKSTQPRPYP